MKSENHLRHAVVSLFLVLASTALFSAEPSFHAGRVLVKLKDAGAAPKEFSHRNAARVAATNAKLQRVELKAGETVEQALAKLRADPKVAWAQTDNLLRSCDTPNDPLLLDGTLWGLRNSGVTGVLGEDIDAPAGWDILSDAQTSIVAVVDSGIRATHEDLAGNMWINPGEIPGNGIDDDANGYIDDVHGINAIAENGASTDDNGHGTHVAGTIGAVGNNGKGVVGVARRVQLMSCKFLGSNGSGYTSDAIEAIEYAVANGAKIINCSWGANGIDQALYDCMKSAAAQNVIFVVAAGNNAMNIDKYAFLPASYDLENIISVSATDRWGSNSFFSNFGSNNVDLSAPGTDIMSTGHLGDSDYQLKSGTSMAAPHVAGALALVRVRFPGERLQVSVNRLMSNVDVGSWLNGRSRSSGRLNLFKALSSTTARPANDNFDQRMRLQIGGTVETGSGGLNYGASTEFAEPQHAATAGGRSLWWNIAPNASGWLEIDTRGSTVDTLLAVYTGSSVSALLPVISNDNETESVKTSRVAFRSTINADYKIAIDSVNGAEGSVGLNIVFTLAPSNDAFGSATPIGLNQTTLTGRNKGASSEPGEPRHAPNSTQASAWWSWTATATRTVSIDTTGSDYDTVLAVYTGNAVNALTLIASNDDGVGIAPCSRVQFNAVKGTTYRIAVDGASGSLGQIRLNVPPLNDDFEIAAPISAASFTLIQDTRYATEQATEPLLDLGGERTIWFKWTPPVSAAAAVATSNTGFDTVLGVYSGSSLSALTTVASNDDDPLGGTRSRVSFSAIAGQTYYIAVGSKFGTAGDLEIQGIADNDGYLVTRLGHLPGRTKASYAADLNNNNKVVGTSFSTYSGADGVAFEWTPDGGMHALSSTGTDVDCKAESLNMTGVTTGYSVSNGWIHGSKWVSGRSSALTLKGSLRGAIHSGNGVTDFGVVMGWGGMDFLEGPFLLEENGDWRFLGNHQRAEPLAMNNNCVVTGYARLNDVAHAIRWWPDGTVEDLHPPTSPNSNSNALEINDYEEVVGNIATQGAVVWSKEGAWRALPPPQGALTPNSVNSVATGINNSGDIVGYFDQQTTVWKNSRAYFLKDKIPVNSELTPTFYFRAFRINDRGVLAGVANYKPYWDGREQQWNYNAVLFTPVVLNEMFVPTISWTAPAEMGLGDILSTEQLNAEASTPGRYKYEPPAGTALPVGTHTLSVIFVPDNPALYVTTTATVQVKVVAKIAWLNPAPIVYPQPLSLNELNATGPGPIQYIPPLGSILDAGEHTLKAVMISTDLGIPLTEATVKILVLPKPVNLFAHDATREYGATNPEFTGGGDSFLFSDRITVRYISTASIATPPGVYPAGTQEAISSIVNDPDQRQWNYSLTVSPGTLTITKATPQLAWSAPVPIVYPQPLSLNELNATGPGPIQYVPPLGSVLDAGEHTLKAVFISKDIGILSTETSVKILVLPKPIHLIANDATREYGVPNPEFTGGGDSFLPQDRITVRYLSAASIVTPPGVYSAGTQEAISPILNDPDQRQWNYSLTVSPGTLTIFTASTPQTMTLLSMNWRKKSRMILLRGRLPLASGLSTAELSGSLNVDGFHEVFTTNTKGVAILAHGKIKLIPGAKKGPPKRTDARFTLTYTLPSAPRENGRLSVQLDSTSYEMRLPALKKR